MVTLTIDNRQVTVPEGTLVVEAARQAGIEIPVFCHHPRLEPVGMCRMCLVEIGAPVRDRQTGELQLDEEGKPVIRWFPKLQTGCTTPVSEGMVVRTRTQRVADVRRGILEFLLTSHPLDCPVCDKGGECPLQDLTFIYGPGTSRFEVEDKYHFEKPIPLGPLIVLDRERCILCARCIRFCDEIPDDHVLGFLNRGRGMEVVTFSNPPFGSKFSGNTIDICPVGALTSADFRFKARVWELTNVESICPHCSVGCNLILGVRTHHIKRVIPRENAAVNDIWLCDKGRFGHHFVGSQERLQRPLIRKDGELTPASWDEALDLVAERLGQIRDEAGPDALGGLAGDRCANEDLYLFQKLFRAVIGTNNVDRWPPEAEPDDLVATLGTGRGTNLGAMGPGSAILLLGADLEEEQPVLMLRVKGAAERGAQLIVANGRPTRLDRYASHRLRYRYGSQIHLLLGLIQVILEEGLEDGEFLAARTEGLGGVRQAARAYNPVQVAELTGVPEETLREAARAFAQAQDGIILFGREALALDDGRALRQALANLLLLTGHVGRANNGLIALLPHNNSRGAADMGLVPYRLPGYAPLDDARARARLEAMWASPPPDDKWSRLSGPGLGAHKMLGGGVKALYVMGADPVAQRPQGLEFLVVQDLFLTETARLADVVLPAASFAEREGTFTNTERRVQRFKQAIRSPGEARADWWIVAEIAKRIKGTQGGWGYASPGQIMDEITRAVPIYGEMSYEALGAVGRRSALREVYEGMSFENVAGEGCQWPAAAEDPTTRFTLHWLEPQAPHEADESFPFTLVAPRLLFDAGTLIARSQILRPLIPQAQVALNATDARRLGIADGDGVQVTSARGSLELTARLDGQVPQGVVLVPQNLGGAAINQLLGPGVIAAQVRIAKVEG